MTENVHTDELHTNTNILSVLSQLEFFSANWVTQNAGMKVIFAADQICDFSCEDDEFANWLPLHSKKTLYFNPADKMMLDFCVGVHKTETAYLTSSIWAFH